jgi:uncharacterized protein YecE (DUF72 family)
MVTSIQTITPRAISINDCDLFIGTSGFSYPEWIDSGFYPEKTKSGRMLELYCRAFNVVELNYTWYQMARAETMERMLMRVDKKKFYFTTKLTRTMTHEISGNWREQAKTYVRGIGPLLSAGRLLAVLIQFPPSFHRTLNNRQYLARLLDCLQDLPLAVEFRHCSWAVEPVFSGLQKRNVTLVAVDLPALPGLFPALNIVTNPLLFYLRLHGRNAGEWFSGNMHKQFDYSYNEQELRSWTEQKIPAMARQCRRGVLFFNNHVAGQAVHNARSMSRLLQQQSS